MLHSAPPAITDPVFCLDRVSLHMGGKPLVKACSFEVARGKFLGLLGPNGAGKSSLLRLLYREKQVTDGRIVAFGKPIDEWSRKDFAARVGTVLQEKAQLSGLTIAQVVALGLFPLRCSMAEEARRTQTALELVELWDRRNENAGNLSGGEQQRLFFAQTLALDPDVYVLDEPNNHLDLYFQILLLDHIKAKGKTVIASFHDMSLAARYCDDAVLMHNAEIVAHGRFGDVMSPARFKSVYRIDAALDEGRVLVGSPIRT